MNFYTIGEFARKIGVSTCTLRRWERNNKLLPHHRTPTGYRVYSSEQVEKYLNGSLEVKDE